MTTATITGGKEAWVGSAYPNRTHFEASRLKVKSGTHYTFIKRATPVPEGDQVGVAKLRVWVAQDATGTFTLKLRRVATRIDWTDLTWNNKPGVTGTSQPTVTVTNPTKGQLLEFTVTTHLQTVANGDPHYGWRIESDSTTLIRLYGHESVQPPELYVEYSATPATPTDLAPAGVISGDKPVLTASADDVTGEDEVVKVRWQLDAASDPVSPDYDSGWVSSTVLELDLTRTDLPGGVFAGIADGATIYQRMQWENDSGNQSEFSDWYAITRKTKPTISITNPPAGGVVTDVTPELLAAASGPIETYRIDVVDPADPKTILATSRKVAATSTTMAFSVPKKVLADNGSYLAKFYAWDDEDRVKAVDDPRYVVATRAFTIDKVDGVEAPVLESVTEHPTLPANVIRVTRTVTPDSFTLYRDGEVLDALIDPADVLDPTTPGAYDLLDPTYTWMDPHTYEVRAVVNGQQSVKSNAITVTHTPTDVWIIDPSKGQSFMLEGTGIDDWGRVDKAGVYQVHGADFSVVIKAGSSGYTGTFKGSLRAAHGRTLASLRAHLKAIQGRGTRPVLLRAANLSIPVILLDLSQGPHPETRPSHPRDQVAFRFIQAPALPEN